MRSTGWSASSTREAGRPGGVIFDGTETQPWQDELYRQQDAEGGAAVWGM